MGNRIITFNVRASQLFRGCMESLQMMILHKGRNFCGRKIGGIYYCDFAPKSQN